MFQRPGMSKVENEQEYLKLLVYSLSESPARVLGIDSAKGTLEVGKQADILVFDPYTEKTVSAKDIQSRYPEVSIYKGKELKGQVKATFLRGEKIYSDDEPELLNQLQRGRVLRKENFKK